MYEVHLRWDLEAHRGGVSNDIVTWDLEEHRGGTLNGSGGTLNGRYPSAAIRCPSELSFEVPYGDAIKGPWGQNPGPKFSSLGDPVLFNHFQVYAVLFCSTISIAIETNFHQYYLFIPLIGSYEGGPSNTPVSC